jgi:two-component system chemotaxis response regulator CheY
LSFCSVLDADSKQLEVLMTWSILIVDDSSLVRSQLRAALEGKGARVVEAENGSQGLWRARENLVDLVVVDIHMPVMDGIRMVEELRKLPEYTTTPIFILTSDATSSRAEEGKRAGANAWILKPVKIDLLWKAIEKALFSRSSLASFRSASIVPPASGGSAK